MTDIATNMIKMENMAKYMYDWLENLLKLSAKDWFKHGEAHSASG